MAQFLAEKMILGHILASEVGKCSKKHIFTLFLGTMQLHGPNLSRKSFFGPKIGRNLGTGVFHPTLSNFQKKNFLEFFQKISPPRLI